MIESVRHRLSFAVRVDDHFTASPVTEELLVEVDSGEEAVRNPQRSGFRHSDGTYRFLSVRPGPRLVRVVSTSGAGFTWTPTTPVAVPLPDPGVPVVVEMWPSAQADAPLGVVAVRGVLVTAAAGQEVRIEPVDTPALGKRTRCDARGEFLFPVPGWTEAVPSTGRVRLDVSVPARTVASVDVVEGTTTTHFVGSQFDVPPGAETRARINLL